MPNFDRYYPFDSGPGANSMEDRWREMGQHWVADGVLSSGLAVTPSAGMVLAVAAGAVFVRGHFAVTDAAKNVTIPAAHASLARWDAVVARLDVSTNTISIEVKSGTAAASPVKPTIDSGPTTYELVLAWVNVPAADTTIDAAQITDGRDLVTPHNGRPRRRNQALNGSFRLWPRGTSFGSAGTNTWGPSRWHFYRSGAVTGATLSRQTGPTGSRYCARVQRDSGNTSTAVIALCQSLPTDDSIPAQGSKVSLRFKARAGANYSPASSLLNATIIGGTGTDQTAFNGITSPTPAFNSNVTLTTAWQEFALSSDSVVAATITQLHLQFNATPVGTAGANDWYEVADVQIEFAPVAGPFEQRTESEERVLCSRFHRRIDAASGAFADFAVGTTTSTTSATFVVSTFDLRAAPALTIAAASNFTLVTAAGNFTPSALSGNNSAPHAVSLTATIAGATAGQGARLSAQNTGAYIDLNAEI